MRSKHIKVLISALCLICLTVLLGVAAACGGEPAALSYTGQTLAAGTVGEAYTASVATASGAAEGAEITYALKDGSTLPAGLTLSAAGEISGTPTASADGHKFTVVASSEGATSAEAEFTLTVSAAPVVAEGFVMEAEYADFSSAQTSAGSFSPLPFGSSDAASNGYYVKDLGHSGCTIIFRFTSDAADSTAVMTYRVRSCVSAPGTLSSDWFRISVNGTVQSYSSESLPTGGPDAAFVEFTLPVSVRSGENTITFALGDVTSNALQLNGDVAMPHFDYVSLDSSAELSWQTRSQNIDLQNGAIGVDVPVD